MNPVKLQEPSSLQEQRKEPAVGGKSMSLALVRAIRHPRPVPNCPQHSSKGSHFNKCTVAATAW